MASFVDISGVLQDFDVLGAYGSDIQDRVNVLVRTEAVTLTEHHVILRVMQISPEGHGKDVFWKDHVQVPEDTPLQSQTVVWSQQKALPKLHQLTWLRGVINWDVCGVNYEFDQNSVMLPVVTNDSPGNTLNWLELFGGGFGGWKSAIDHFQATMPSGRIRSVAIEHDASTAMSYALTNHTGYVQTRHEMPADFLTDNDMDWTICDDVLSTRWNTAVANMGVDVVSISSPCPPWSSATNAPGLSKPDGLLMMQSIMTCRFLRPVFILLEQVANFALHPHRAIITRALHSIGYRLVMQKILNPTELLKVDRPRWLALAIRVHSGHQLNAVPSWNVTNLQPPQQDVVFRCWTGDVKTQLELDARAFQVANDPRFVRLNSHQQHPIQNRIKDPLEVIPTFMRLYGRQHELDEEYLVKYKFYGHYMKDESCAHGCRHWHPTEIALKQGLTNQCFMFEDMCEAWQIQGNVVTPIQVIPLLVAVTNTLWNQQTDVQVVSQTYLDATWKAQQTGFQWIEGGYFMVQLNDPIPQHWLNEYANLVHMVRVDGATEIIWFPSSLETDEVPPGQCDPTPVSPPTPMQPDDDETMATQPFQVVLKAKTVFGDNHQNFWFEASIPYDLMRELWDHMFAPVVIDQPEVGMPVFEFRYDPDYLETDYSDGSRPLLVILDDEALTVMRQDKHVPIVNHAALRHMHTPHDQFGPLHPHKLPVDHLLIVPQSLPLPRLPVLTVFMMAAFPDCRVVWAWNPLTDHLLLGIQGPPVPKKTIADFWAGLLTPNMLQILGRQVQFESNSHQILISFRPSRSDGVCPHKQLRMVLAISAARVMLSNVMESAPTEHRLKLTWMQSTLWEGSVDGNKHVSVIQQILNIALQPYYGNAKFALSGRDHWLNETTRLDQIATHVLPEVTVLPVPNQILRLTGGGGAKQQQKQHQQSAIASMLLEQGYELKWITDTVESLVSKYGLPRLQSITSQPMGGPRIKSLLGLIEEAKIELPKPSRPASQTQAEGTPWRPKKKRVDERPVDPTEFEICADFFKCEDGSPIQQLAELRPQASGVCIVSPMQAQPWIQSGQPTSSDELALLVIGKLAGETVLPNHEIRFPCLNQSKQMVILSGVIVQLGSKKVCWNKGDDTKIATEGSTLVALTLHKSDFPTDIWMDVTTRTIPTVRKLLAQEQMDVAQSIWGKSLRRGKNPATPIQAESVQVHAAIPDNKLEEFLRASGFNKIYATPKEPNGRLSLKYRVVWSSVEPSQALPLAAQISGCLGLVKGKATLGYRVKLDDHEKAWQVLNPGQPLPERPGGDIVYKAMGLPFGVTQGMMTKWLSTIGWKATPLKALGPSGYLLRAETHVPPGIHMFNGSPILLQFLPEKDNHKQPIILGPRGAQMAKGSTMDPFQQPGQDPWAGFQRATLPTPARAITGPTEQRLQAQDDKIPLCKQISRRWCKPKIPCDRKPVSNWRPWKKQLGINLPKSHSP
eukprot:Skav215502  [mRNA]  locus=scaffold165:838310:842707:- [translate_table: standard]